MKLKTCKKQTNPSRIMIQCRTMVERDAVKRVSIDGVEHIIVSSSTLPDDIVMNGGLYPAEEIAKSFESLELTLAPIEHPNINGQFISANDPRAIHGFHAGAFNMNVRRENGRVHIDKYINVAEAMKTDRGKRLLDRIDELETNSDPRPIHTSVGVFLLPEELKEPKTNADGDEYTWIARDMLFDHDAILLDSVGAAQPHQGVGVAVNSKGEEFRVDQFTLDDTAENRAKTIADSYLADNQSYNNLVEQLQNAIKSSVTADWIYVVDIVDDMAIFDSSIGYFQVPFVVDENEKATLVGIPVRVDRVTTYVPKTNHSEGDPMKDLMLKALADAGVTVNADISDADLLATYTELQANQSEGDNSADDDDSVVVNAVEKALAPLAEKIEGLQAKLNAADNAELDRLADLVGNSDKYPGLDVEAAKKLGIDTLKSMAANCAQAFGVSPTINQSSAGAQFDAPAEMPN